MTSEPDVRPAPSRTQTLLVPVSRLTPAPWNPRTITDPRFAALCRSLEADPDFLWDRPILAMADGTVYAGNMRFRAALHIGWTEIPARLEDVSELVARSRAERDNNSAGEYERELLEANRRSIVVLGGNPDATGFTRDDVARLFAKLPRTEPLADPEPALDRAAELQAQWGTQSGDVWTIPSRSMPGARHRLVCGDARRPEDHARLMDGGRASLIWTDPPYGVDYTGKTADALEIEGDSAEGLPDLLLAAFRQCAAAAIESAPFYVCHPAGPGALTFALALRDAGWRLHETLVWVKDAIVLGHGDMHYQHEPIAYGTLPKKAHRTAASAYTEEHVPIYYGWTPGGAAVSRGGASSRWYGGDNQSTVFQVARPTRSTLHPTMKPLDLIARQIGNSSRPGEIVLDPFAGSGSTLLAAEQSARLGYGLEIDPRYAAVALQRLADLGLAPERDDPMQA